MCPPSDQIKRSGFHVLIFLAPMHLVRKWPISRIFAHDLTSQILARHRLRGRVVTVRRVNHGCPRWMAPKTSGTTSGGSRNLLRLRPRSTHRQQAHKRNTGSAGHAGRAQMENHMELTLEQRCQALAQENPALDQKVEGAFKAAGSLNMMVLLATFPGVDELALRQSIERLMSQGIIRCSNADAAG